VVVPQVQETEVGVIATLAMVKQKLVKKQISQAEVARRVGCTPMAISKVLSGAFMSPYLQTVIAEILHEDPATLWGEAGWLLGYKKRRSEAKALRPVDNLLFDLFEHPTFADLGAGI
jgi:transcriptional regulator with XRE-family HTH domain